MCSVRDTGIRIKTKNILPTFQMGQKPWPRLALNEICTGSNNTWYHCSRMVDLVHNSSRDFTRKQRLRLAFKKCMYDLLLHST